MFGLFRKKHARLIRESDCVYASRELADQVLVESAAQLSAQGTPVIVASFFRGSLARIQAALERSGLRPRWVEPRSDWSMRQVERCALTTSAWQRLTTTSASCFVAGRRQSFKTPLPVSIPT